MTTQTQHKHKHDTLDWVTTVQDKPVVLQLHVTVKCEMIDLNSDAEEES